MAERLDLQEDKSMRLSDFRATATPKDEPEIMRLGDWRSLERIETPELNEVSFFETSDEQRKQWKDAGKIGYFEQAIRQDKSEMLPFNPESAVKSIKLLNAVNRIKRDKYENDPEQKNIDMNRVNNFLRLSEEERIRGYTIGGRVTQGVAALPAFMIEFLATGGMASLGKAAVSKSIKPIVRTIAKRTALKYTTRIVGGLAGATLRTTAMPHRVVGSYAERQLNASLELTENGLQIAKESREKPYISAMKAFGDVVIENFSEVTGPELAKIATKAIPKKFAFGLTKLFKKLHPNKSTKTLFTKLGYHGFLEELGEERVGAFLRAVTGVEDFGADNPDSMFDRIISSIPNGEELLIEAGVLAFPGAMQAGAQQIAKIIQSRKTVERPGEVLIDEKTGESKVIKGFNQDISDKTIDEILATTETTTLPAVEPTPITEEAVVPEAVPVVEKPAKVAPEAIPEELQPLIEEAKKYKSAEEFVEKVKPISQAKTGEPIVIKGYHGTPDARFLEEFDQTKTGYYPDAPELLPDMKEWVNLHGKPSTGFKTDKGVYAGLSFSDDYKVAKSYSEKPAFDYQNSVPMVVERNIILKNPKVIDATGKKMWEIGLEDIVEQAKKEGYDGVVFKEIKDNYHPQTTVSPSNNVVVFNADQIKTKAQLTETWNKAQAPIQKEALIEEAKKYKSAEEFVEKNLWKENESPYPLEDISLWYGDANYKQAGGILRSMTPQEFLDAAAPLKIDDIARENINDLKTHIKAGNKLDPLSLYNLDKQTGARSSDGRHRAIVAKELGMKTVPVVDFTSQLTDIWNKAQAPIQKEAKGEVTKAQLEPKIDSRTQETLRRHRVENINSISDIEKSIINKEKEIKALKKIELESQDIEETFEAQKLIEQYTTEIKDDKWIIEGYSERVKSQAPIQKEAIVEIDFEQRLKEIREKFKRPETIAKKEVKAVQEEIIKELEKSGIEAKDKAKFIRAIKNIQTSEQLSKILPEIEQRITSLKEAAESRGLRAKIAKQLKITKPKKVSGKPVGKFTPEVQDILDRARIASKLTLDQAQEMIVSNLENQGNEIPTAEQALENKILSLFGGIKYKGKSSKELKVSLRVLRDLIEKGRSENLARLQEHKEKRTEDRERSLKSIIGKKTPSTSRIKNPMDNLRKTLSEPFKTMMGWDNILDTLSRDDTTMAGQSDLSKIAKVSSQETAEKGLRRRSIEQVLDIGMKAFNLKTNSQLVKQFRQDSLIKDLGIFKNNRGEEINFELSMAEARKVWMELQDPSLVESLINEKGNAYSPTMIQAIDDFVTKEHKAFAEAQLQFYREFYNKVVNPVYSDIYGINLPFNEFYSPISREHKITTTTDEFLKEMGFRRSVTTGSLKNRVKNLNPLKIQSDVAVLQKHIIEMAHFVTWADKIRQLNSIFTNNEVRDMINKKYGGEMLRVINDFMKDFTTGRIDQSKNFGFWDKLRVNFTRSVLAGKAVLFTKQIVSFVAYADAIPITAFTKGVADFMAHPLEKTKILNESEFMKARGANLTRDIRDAMTSDEFSAFRQKPSFKNMLMLTTKLGDRGAILLGGWSVYKYTFDKTGDSAKAMQAFEDKSSDTQQSSDLSQLSVWQRGNTFQKMFTMFTSSQNQYFRKEYMAIRNLIARRTTVKKAAKTIFIFHFILPMFFQWVSDFGKWNKDEQLRAAILGSFNGIFIIKDVLDSIIRQLLGLKRFKTTLPILTIPDGIFKAMTVLDIDDILFEDVMFALKELSETAGLITGLPAKQVGNWVEGIKNIQEGEKGRGALKLLGWTDYVIDNNEE